MIGAREDASLLGLRPGNDFSSQVSGHASAHIRAWLASSFLLGLIFVTCAVFYVWVYVQQVQNGYRLAKIYEEIELQNSVQRKLKLEWSRFRDPTRLEDIGRNHFGLAPPRADQKVLMR